MDLFTAEEGKTLARINEDGRVPAGLGLPGTFEIHQVSIIVSQALTSRATHNCNFAQLAFAIELSATDLLVKDFQDN